MNIFIYTGSFKSTTFINRLIIGLEKTSNNIFVIGKDDLPKKNRIKNIIYLDVGFSFKTTFNLLREFIFLPLISYLKNRDLDQLRIKLTKIYIKKYKPTLIHFQWPPSEKLVNSLNKNTPIILSLRGRLINSAPFSDDKLIESYRRFFPRINAFHAVSSEILKNLSYFNVNSFKSKVVYSGIDLKKYKYTEKWNKKELSIISIGRSNWKKGYNYALHACQILKDNNINFSYRIIVDRSEELIFNINDLKLVENVKTINPMPHDKIINQISNSDILLLTSVEEGIANVVIEAMALGTIVISTDCGGMKELVKDGVNGFIVPPRDPHLIAQKIIQLSASTNQIRNSLTSNARKTIEENHTEEIMITKMIELYNDVSKN